MKKEGKIGTFFMGGFQCVSTKLSYQISRLNCTI
jgi:hypothetical protein